ncbi:MAG TPA: ABC transporter permease [Polyangia bacterium]|nr:ABC transporter permease [Polyangia bacterium]
MARGAGFEWMVAWRHLRDPDTKTHRTLWTGLIMMLIGMLARVFATYAPTLLHLKTAMAPGEWREARAAEWISYVNIGGHLSLDIGSTIVLLGVLFAIFTVFTALSIFGVFLGTSAPIIALSVMSGFENDLKTKIRSTKADVVIETSDGRAFTDWKAVEAKLAGVRDIAGLMPYVEAEVIVKHATNAAGMGIILRGVDPVAAAEVLGIGAKMKEGKLDYLAHPEQIPNDLIMMPGSEKDENAPRILPGIILGEELFQHILRVFLGSEVDVACPMCGVGPTGPMPKLKSFRVAGHFYSGMYEFDSKLAYVSLRDAQKFLGIGDEVTGIEIRTVTPEAAIDVAKQIGARLGPTYEVRSWEELNKSLYAALKLEKLAMFIGLSFIALVASFSIIANLIMMVTEKAREIAILKSMGARDGAILRIFFAEGLYIGVLGLALGVVSGIAACYQLATQGLPLPAEVYYIEKMPVVMRASEIAAVSLAALALCCLATIYPALLASRLRPVDGLRYE